MTEPWHWYIAIFTVVSIVCWLWMIVWTSRQGDDDKAAMDTLDHGWDGDLRERNNPLPRWWLYLFVGTIVWGLGYLIWYPGLGAFEGVGDWSQIGQYEAEREKIDAVYQARFAELAALDFAELTRHREAMDTASRLYGANCSTCHGADARGATGFPNLVDDNWQYGGDPQTIVQSITNGRQGVMPAWAAALGEDGTRQTVEYVRRLGGLEHDAALADAGVKHYNTYCIACHGGEGKGMQALGAPNLTDDVWLYGSSRDALTATLVHGRNGVMPAQKDLLSPEEIKLLAAYLLSLGKPETAMAGTNAAGGAR